jgi:hypothetical protein
MGHDRGPHRFLSDLLLFAYRTLLMRLLSPPVVENFFVRKNVGIRLRIAGSIPTPVYDGFGSVEWTMFDNETPVLFVSIFCPSATAGR